MASPSRNLPGSQEVSTKWEYLDLNHTAFTSTLPGDVVQISLQVKTVKGMYTVHHDAWGGHTQHFKKWGSQITPTAATRNKVEKFKSQWNAYVRSTSVPRGNRQRGPRRVVTQVPPVDPPTLHQPRKERKQPPWVFKKAAATSTAPHACPHLDWMWIPGNVPAPG